MALGLCSESRAIPLSQAQIWHQHRRRRLRRLDAALDSELSRSLDPSDPQLPQASNTAATHAASDGTAPMVQRASASNEEGDEVAVATEAEEKTPQSDTVVSPRLSVRDYHVAHRARFGSPTRSPAASAAPSDHELEEGQVDCDSDNDFVGRSPLPAHTAPVRTPCPFPAFPGALRLAPPLPSRDDDEEREVGVITNPLDTVQEQQVAVEDAAAAYTTAARLPTRREYRFDPQTRGSHNLLASEDLSTYATGPAAQTADEVVARDALPERYLSPMAFSVFDYRTRLFEQRSGRSVPAIRGIPIIRGPHETEAQHEALFQRWCEEVRNLPSLSTLQDSWSKYDVLIERRLRFDFAKLKARRQLPPGYRPVGGATVTAPARIAVPASSTTSVASATSTVPASGQSSAPAANPAAPSVTRKRAATAASAPSADAEATQDHSDQKRPRRHGSLASEAPQTPTSSVNVDSHATSPDTGFGPGDDVAQEDAPRDSEDHHAHRAEQEEDDEDGPSGLHATQEEFSELSRQVRRLREHVVSHDWAMQRQDRAIDEIPEQMDWFEAPSLVQNRLSSLQSQNSLQNHVNRLQAQLNLLMQMQRPAPGYPAYPPAVPYPPTYGAAPSAYGAPHPAPDPRQPPPPGRDTA